MNFAEIDTSSLVAPFSAVFSRTFIYDCVYTSPRAFFRSFIDCISESSETA